MFAEEFERGRVWGLLTSVDLFGCDPEIIDSEEHVKEFVVDLCDLIDMKRFGECLVYRFGSGDKEGLSFLQLIETSLVSGHLSNELGSAYIDIFSCKSYDPSMVLEFSKKFFMAQKATCHTIPRFSKPEP